MKFLPSLADFTVHSKKYNLIPVYTEIFADTETPVSTFLKLAGSSPYSYLLESVEGGERWGRYSYISSEPKRIFCVKDGSFTLTDSSGKVIRSGVSQDPLKELEAIMAGYVPAPVSGLPRFLGGAVGFAGYEMVKYFEEIPEAPNRAIACPDSIFLINDLIVVFDHLTHTTKVVSCVETGTGGRDPSTLYRRACAKIDSAIKNLQKPVSHTAARGASLKKTPVRSNITRESFISKVRKAKEYIRNGDIIQVQISQRFSKETPAKPFDIYRALRNVNPSPYMYYMDMGGFQIIGSSPEILVRKISSSVETRPIAGTKPRGSTLEEEKKYEKELLGSTKELAEHIMLVDLGRNDLGRVCRPSTVTVPSLMKVEKYSHVMHIVSSVTGILRKGLNAFDLFRACFPAGTVTGAPKIRAMEIISELERDTRGIYAGAVGYFSYSGNMDMAITIRTAFYRKGTAHVQAAAGIVADSVPAKEYAETQYKAKALLRAIEIAEEGLQ